MKLKAILLAMMFGLISHTSMAASPVSTENDLFLKGELPNQEVLSKLYETSPSRTFVKMFLAFYEQELNINQKLDRLIVLLEREHL